MNNELKKLECGSCHSVIWEIAVGKDKIICRRCGIEFPFESRPAESELLFPKKKVCRWDLLGDDNSLCNGYHYYTDCPDGGDIYIADKPSELDYKFCPYCGREIEEV